VSEVQEKEKEITIIEWSQGEYPLPEVGRGISRVLIRVMIRSGKGNIKWEKT